MKSVYHPSDSRGHANWGWLDTWHSFSFANYYNPERMQFGVLRVLNDDTVEGGRGFDTHPHENMEIISIPLKGELEHRDSMGNIHVIGENEVQVMSAGTGIFHSEYNRNPDQLTNFLQIWVFPNQQNIKPRYDQQFFNPDERINRFQQLVSPDPEGDGVWIHQDAWFSRISLEKGKDAVYQLHQSQNGLYLFILEGKIKAGDQTLQKRDGYGVWETDEVKLSSSSHTDILLLEIPMSL